MFISGAGGHILGMSASFLFTETEHMDGNNFIPHDFPVLCFASGAFWLDFFKKIIIILITANPKMMVISKESRIRLGVLTSLALMIRASL